MAETIINSDLALETHIRDLRKAYYDNRYLIITMPKGRQRTLTQNAALHMFCQMLADQLNASGLDMRKVMKPEAEIPWSLESVKEIMWKPLQEAIIGKASTTEADRVEYSHVYEVLGRHLAKTQGINIPDWPRKENAA
jgi:hypothetical protein